MYCFMQMTLLQQYWFSDISVSCITNVIKSLGFEKVLCIGAPRYILQISVNYGTQFFSIMTRKIFPFKLIFSSEVIYGLNQLKLILVICRMKYILNFRLHEHIRQLYLEDGTAVQSILLDLDYKLVNFSTVLLGEIFVSL